MQIPTQTHTQNHNPLAQPSLKQTAPQFPIAPFTNTKSSPKPHANDKSSTRHPAQKAASPTQAHDKNKNTSSITRSLCNNTNSSRLSQPTPPTSPRILKQKRRRAQTQTKAHNPTILNDEQTNCQNNSPQSLHFENEKRTLNPDPSPATNAPPPRKLNREHP